MADMHDASRTVRSAGGRWDGERIFAAFNAATANKPWTLAYRTVEEDRIACVAETSGELPKALLGTFFRNGPARHSRGGCRYGHQWDGDGMVQAFRLTDHGVSHVGQYIHTGKYLEETSLGRFTRNTFGSQVSPGEPVPEDIDRLNPANISVIHYAGELLALWEAGSAYALEADSLNSIGPKVWPDGESRPFSAHPKIDSDGSMWNFGVDLQAGRIVIHHISHDGTRLSEQHIVVDDLPPVHDFAVTTRHLVFLLPSFRFSHVRLAAGASFAEACEWAPTTPMQALVVDKDGGKQHRFELPPGCVFHMANAADEGDGTIRLHYMRAEGPMSLLAGWSVMRGEYRHLEGAKLTQVELRLQPGIAMQHLIGELDSEFPAIDPRRIGQRDALIVCLERSRERRGDCPGFDQVALHDLDSKTVQRFRYGDGWMVEEHLLVSRRDDSGATWIIGTALDLSNRQTVLSVFPADQLPAGPVFQARLVYALPIGLHGHFAPLA